MDDKDIIELFFQRNELAIEETRCKYSRLCYSVAYNILAVEEDAEECVSDALLNAWNSIPPHQPRVLAAFLSSLTRCAALKKWRGMRAQKRGGGETALVYEELGECLPDNEDVQLRLETQELAAMINRFVAALPETERRVFVCRYWYCDSLDDICARFGFSRSKAKSMLHRIRKRLHEALRKEGALE